MTFARSLRILLAILLLSAQHAALSHAISHLDKQGLPPQEQLLCDQHDALGTVAGALDSAVTLPPGDAPAGFQFYFSEQPSAVTPGLAPSSRGPPAFL